MKSVIMAGGKGTRIASVNSEVPKPMIPILGKPILEYEIDVLKKQGYTDIILAVGYLGQCIKDYFGDGSRFGVSISYVEEKEPLGTAGALYLLKGLLTEDFLLLNGDIIFDVDLERFAKFHRKTGGMATLLTHPNAHPYDSGILIADENGRAVNWLHKEDPRQWYRNRVNAGMHMISPAIFQDPAGTGAFRTLRKLDLDREVLKPLIDKRQLYVYDSPEYVKDMGTPDRYQEVTRDIASGKVQAKNLKRKQRAVFMDRDGTINEYVGFLRDLEDFRLLPQTGEAIRKINVSGWLAVVVTNQPVIARGEVSVGQLREIHNKMETLLGAEGAYLDGIYYCPHHPHGGYPGEIQELKVPCECRKPKPGMLLQAARDYNIDLKNSWMIGDGEADIQAGKAAGCHTALINVSAEDYGQELTVSSLKEFTEKVLGS